MVKITLLRKNSIENELKKRMSSTLPIEGVFVMFDNASGFIDLLKNAVRTSGSISHSPLAYMASEILRRIPKKCTCHESPPL